MIGDPIFPYLILLKYPGLIETYEEHCYVHPRHMSTSTSPSWSSSLTLSDNTSSFRNKPLSLSFRACLCSFSCLFRNAFCCSFLCLDRFFESRILSAALADRLLSLWVRLMLALELEAEWPPLEPVLLAVLTILALLLLTLAPLTPLVLAVL